MQFLTPLFFLGALAVAGPILLHLVRRDQRNRMLFPSLMFLRRVPIQEYRRRKLRYLLLLFLRCLGLLLLVAAFASPVTHLAWFGAVSGQVSRSLVVLLDNSMSMARPGVWERALEKARAKIGSMQGTDQACLILFAAKPAVLSAWESRSADVCCRSWRTGRSPHSRAPRTWRDCGRQPNSSTRRRRDAGRST